MAAQEIPRFSEHDLGRDDFASTLDSPHQGRLLARVRFLFGSLVPCHEPPFQGSFAAPWRTDYSEPVVLGRSDFFDGRESNESGHGRFLSPTRHPE